MKMKKLAAVLATAAMVLGLVGCGETSSTSNADTSTSTPASVVESVSAEASASEETPAEPVPEEKAPAEKTEPVSEPKTEEPEVKEQQVAKEEPVKQQPAEPEPAVEIPVNPEPEVTEEVSYDMVLTFLIMNESNVRYGMISMINPYTKEQVRIGALGANEMFAFTMNWPSSEKHFRLAVYDEAGNLVREENIDFHKVTAGCAVKLIGDGSLSDIISEIE